MELRKSLQWFAEEMEEVLLSNEYKGGWENARNIRLLDYLEKEVRELKAALIDGDKSDILNECCDVANFAMMIADNNKEQE